MKIRNAFISNSSSSSFILALDKFPQDITELQQLLFDNLEPIYYYNDEEFSISNISEYLFTNLNWNLDDIHNNLQEHITSEVIENIRSCIENRNTWCLYDNSFITEQKISTIKINKYKTELKSVFSNIDWDFKFKQILQYYDLYINQENKLYKEYLALISDLEKQYNCAHTYKDKTKMSLEEKQIYELEEKKKTKIREDKVLNNPTIKEKETKRHQILTKIYNPDQNIVEITELIVNSLIEIFYTKNKNKIFAMIDVYDDTSLGCAMEHGSIFNFIPHMKFSNH